MSKRLSKYIAFFDYFDKLLMVLSVTTGSISVASFVTVIETTVGIVNTNRNKKKKHNKIVMLARSKLSSIERKVSEALINNEIRHEDFIMIINEEKKYRELKESIRMMNSQRSEGEKINLIEEDNKLGINEVIKRNKIINNSLKR